MAEQTQPLQVLEGALERLTYQNEENGYTVARLVPKGKSYEVTVIGVLTGVSAGETLQLRGTWTTHPRYGRQFEIKSYTVKLPATVEGIRKYLGSGLIRGVGPVTASRIVDHFGLTTLEVIEEDVQRLCEIPGVGLKRATLIAKAWEEQKQIKEVILFLQSHGISTGLAVKIYKQYGDTAIQVVKTSPYQLARDIHGIGFLTADKIARQMGIALDAPERIQAGVRYALSAFSDDGHCYAARPALIDAAAELLQLAPALCEAQLDALVKAHDVVSIETEAVVVPELAP
jgi:exodeoxyribonuclease V alpha subunit